MSKYQIPPHFGHHSCESRSSEDDNVNDLSHELSSSSELAADTVYLGGSGRGARGPAACESHARSMWLPEFDSRQLAIGALILVACVGAAVLAFFINRGPTVRPKVYFRRIPSRAISAYEFFKRTKREEIETANPEATSKELRELMEQMWNKMNKDKKQHTAAAAADQKRFLMEQDTIDTDLIHELNQASDPCCRARGLLRNSSLASTV